jgi:hypothetical protein
MSARTQRPEAAVNAATRPIATDFVDHVNTLEFRGAA